MKRSHRLKGVMHWEMFQNTTKAAMWAKMHWQDGGSQIDLPIEMDDQHRYATSGLLSEELERQNLVLRFSPHKELKAIYAADTYSPDLIRMFLNIFDSMNVNTPATMACVPLARTNGLTMPTMPPGATAAPTKSPTATLATDLGENQKCLYRGVASAARRNQLLVKLRRSTANPRPATNGVAARRRAGGQHHRRYHH